MRLSGKNRIAAILAVALAAVVGLAIGFSRLRGVPFQLRNFTGGPISQVEVSYPDGSHRFWRVPNRGSVRIYVPRSAVASFAIRYRDAQGTSREIAGDRCGRLFHELIPWDRVLDSPSPSPDIDRMDVTLDPSHQAVLETRCGESLGETDFKRWSYRLDFMVKYVAQAVFP